MACWNRSFSPARYDWSSNWIVLPSDIISFPAGAMLLLSPGEAAHMKFSLFTVLYFGIILQYLSVEPFETLAFLLVQVFSFVYPETARALLGGGCPNPELTKTTAPKSAPTQASGTPIYYLCVPHLWTLLCASISTQTPHRELHHRHPQSFIFNTVF